MSGEDTIKKLDKLGENSETVLVKSSQVKSSQYSLNFSKKQLTFIDLFAGIGGFRLAGESYGARCVFSSEWDKHSKITYRANYGEEPAGDITKIASNEIPDHDILFAGFPCQAFSISGKRRGFEDTRGTLFFDVARILKAKKPSMFLLENVKNLATHDNGNTLKVILSTLEQLGYKVYYQVLRASDYEVPQARERIYIVGFENHSVNFSFPKPKNNTRVVADILEKDEIVDAKVIKRDFIFNQTSEIKDVRKPKRIGYFNKGGQGERIYSVNAAGITLSAYGGGQAGKTGAYLVGDTVRRLSPRECARLQGFPDNFTIPVSHNYALKQFGDSVSVPVIKEVVRNMIGAFNEL